jgi:hypothetical protein
MKIIVVLLLAASSALAGDLRNVSGAVVDLAPIYQWRETNGPPTNRPFPAWKEVRVVQVGAPVSVYTKCVVVMDGMTNAILADHLPDKIKKFLADEAQLEAQAAQLSQFVTSETQRLRITGAQAQNWDPSSPDYNQFLLDRSTLDNRKEQLDLLTRQLQEMKTREPGETTDYAIQMNKIYTGMQVWDFGLKPRVPEL